MIVEHSVLAECLNLSGARVSQLVEEGMPNYAHGLYDLGPCIQWYIENCIMPTNRSSTAVDTHERLYEVHTHKTELGTANTRGETVPADLYIEDLHHLQDVVERALTGIDRGLAEDLNHLGDPEEISDRLQLATIRIRTAIADGLDRYVATIKE